MRHDLDFDFTCIPQDGEHTPENLCLKADFIIFPYSPGCIVFLAGWRLIFVQQFGCLHGL